MYAVSLTSTRAEPGVDGSLGCIPVVFGALEETCNFVGVPLCFQFLDYELFNSRELLDLCPLKFTHTFTESGLRIRLLSSVDTLRAVLMYLIRNRIVTTA